MRDEDRRLLRGFKRFDLFGCEGQIRKRRGAQRCNGQVLRVESTCVAHAFMVAYVPALCERGTGVEVNALARILYPRPMPTIYVYLLDENVDVWRPVEAEPVGDAFRIVGEPPDDEKWEFQPGEVVRCETRMLTQRGPSEAEPHLIAVERVEHP